MTAAVEDRAAVRAAGRGWGSRAGYGGALLSMAGVDLALSAVFVAMAGKPAALLLRLPEIGIFLVVLPLLLGRRLYRPIALFERGDGPAEPAARRLGRLAADTGWMCLGCSVLFSTSSFLVTPFLVYRLPMEPDILAILLARAVAWVVLLPYVAYFLAHEHVRLLRLRLWRERGLASAPGRMTLGAKLLMVVLGGGFVPFLSIAATIMFVPPISPITGQPREVIILVAVIGSLVALSTAFWAMHRSLSATLGAMSEGLAAVRGGDLGRRLAIQTDDDLGRLSADLNVLSAALQDSTAAARRAEDERMRAAAQFHEAQKQSALGRLAAGVAHDFNNILAIVMAYAATARKKLEPDHPGAAMLSEVLTAAERGRDLIARIMAFAREGDDRLGPIDLSACARQSVEWLTVALGPEADLRARLPDEPVEIMGDATAMHQVMANLCVNAAHAARGGRVRIDLSLDRIRIDGGRAEGLARRLKGAEPEIVFETDDPTDLRGFVGVLSPGRHARLTVRDDGAGIDAATLRRVFEPYFTTKPVGQGTGLGLSAIMGIVARHDGAITLRTRPGGGASFEIFLPLRDQGV